MKVPVESSCESNARETVDAVSALNKSDLLPLSREGDDMAHSPTQLSSVAPLQAGDDPVPWPCPYCLTATVPTQSGSIRAVTFAPRILGCLLLESQSSREDRCVCLLLLEMQIGATLMIDSHTRFLGNRALSPETLMMGYGYDPFLCPSARSSRRSSTPRLSCFDPLRTGRSSSSWPTACGKSARMKSPD